VQLSPVLAACQKQHLRDRQPSWLLAKSHHPKRSERKISDNVAGGRGDNVDTNFGGLPPTKFGRAKDVQNSARFLTTFDFDRKYLWNGSTYRKLEKYLINYISSPIGRQKLGELWSTNKKVITV